jgi:hypothetical protein
VGIAFAFGERLPSGKMLALPVHFSFSEKKKKEKKNWSTIRKR